MTRADVLDKAMAITVFGCRNADGERENCFLSIARMWSAYLEGRGYREVCLSEADVCQLMVLLKVARFAHGRAQEDDLIDIAGYAACAADGRPEPEKKEEPEGRFVCGNCLHHHHNDETSVYCSVERKAVDMSEVTSDCMNFKPGHNVTCADCKHSYLDEQNCRVCIPQGRRTADEAPICDKFAERG